MTMQKIITRYIAIVVIVSALVISGLSWIMQEQSAKASAEKNAQVKLEQIISTLDNNKKELQNLTESLNEDYLTRAYAFAYIIQTNPSVLDSLSELEKIKNLLRVDELHVINEKGILYAGTIPKYYGMEFSSTKQTSEFLSILDHGGYLVQDIQPNGAEKKIFQYIGVARQDRKGIVQIGLAPTRILEAQKKNKISYIISRMPMDEGTAVFAIDKEEGTIVAHSDDKLVDKKVDTIGISLKKLLEIDGSKTITLNHNKIFCVTKDYDDMLLGITFTNTALFENRMMVMITALISLLLIGVVMILTMRYLIKRKIVAGIHQIMNDVSQITSGNLDTVATTDNTPEFKQLSSDINKMVRSILDASVKVSKVIDIVDMPIGVFEFNHEQPQVMATDRLRLIMNWDQAKANTLYADKNAFMKELTNVMDLNRTRASNIYMLDTQPEKWIKIYMATDENGTFGVISDVTKEQEEKKKIEYERDHDPLTKLKNIKTFKRLVSHHINKANNTPCAMVMLDLDNFKLMNDCYGHEWGDCYLKAFADILKSFENEHLIAARRSGDEFCLFLYDYETPDEIRQKIQECHKILTTHTIVYPDQTVHTIHVSIGYAWYCKNLSGYVELMRAADSAMYTSKHQGKGIIVEYTEEKKNHSQP